MKRINDDRLTYISLFSSAGVGCYGFKMRGFECIATNEIVERRINVQKFNENANMKQVIFVGILLRKASSSTCWEK